MKKRCTASACRRLFNSRYDFCPYCGKEYPQIKGLWDVWLTGYTGKIKCIKLYRGLFGSGLAETKEKVERVLRGEPLLFGSALSRAAAEELVGQIRDAGGIAQIREHGRKAPKAPPVEKIIKAEKPVKISLPIEELGLSVRSFNCLTRAGIKTTDDLVRMTEEELIKVRNLGRKSLEEILITLESVGLSIMEEE